MLVVAKSRGAFRGMAVGDPREAAGARVPGAPRHVRGHSDRGPQPGAYHRSGLFDAVLRHQLRFREKVRVLSAATAVGLVLLCISTLYSCT